MDELRIVLVGKTGVGKSATGNTILGETAFKSTVHYRSVTTECQKETAVIDETIVTVIDTPGLFDTNNTEAIKEEIRKCIKLSSPGPHAFVMVIQAGRFTEQEKIIADQLQDIFGQESLKYTIVLFSYADNLDADLEEFVKQAPKDLKNLLKKCGKRYYAFNNKQHEGKEQVTELIKKIKNMLIANGGSCYTNEMRMESLEGNAEQIEENTNDKNSNGEKKKKEGNVAAEYFYKGIHWARNKFNI